MSRWAFFAKSVGTWIKAVAAVNFLRLDVNEFNPYSTMAMVFTFYARGNCETG